MDPAFKPAEDEQKTLKDVPETVSETAGADLPMDAGSSVSEQRSDSVYDFPPENRTNPPNGTQEGVSADQHIPMSPGRANLRLGQRMALVSFVIFIVVAPWLGAEIGSSQTTDRSYLAIHFCEGILALCLIGCFISGMFASIGAYMDRNEPAPAKLKSGWMSLLPLVVVLVYSRLGLLEISPYMLMVYCAVVLNAIGAFAMFQAKRLGTWSLAFVIFILPVVLLTTIGPVVHKLATALYLQQ